MMKLAMRICQRRGWPQDQAVYQLPPGAKHFDNFEPALHKIHLLDDMSQFMQPDVDTGPMLIQMKTNAPYNTPQADVTAKGKRFYNCEYIIGSTNSPFPVHTGVL